jgi:putative membrane protein
VETLNGLSGKDFDKEYIDRMVSDHTTTPVAFTKEGKDNKDVKFRTAELKGKTKVAAQKNMAFELKKALITRRMLQPDSLEGYGQVPDPLPRPLTHCG